jgi:hypothetical protein
MSKADSPSTETELPYTPSASFAPCRRCEEGALVWDADAAVTRCRCCGLVP